MSNPSHLPRERRTDQPRRVRHGVRLRHREGVISHSVVSERWLGHFLRMVDAEELEAGQRYARLGQTIELKVDAGRIRCRVQGTAPQPYVVKLDFPVFNVGQWDAIVADMAAEAVYLVKLLACEVPESIDELLARHDLHLVPQVFGPEQARCTCSRTGICRHMTAIAFLLAERISREPMTAIALRGIVPARLVERLRHTRAIRARGVASAHVDPMIPESQIASRPLEECANSYWRLGPGFDQLQEMPPSQHLRQALLRRLGPSPLEGRFPLVGLLASIYDTVADHAVDLRDRAEHVDGEV